MKAIFSRRKSIILLCITEMFERLSYYGIRALLVLYATDTTNGLGLSNENALSYYGYFILLASISILPIGIITDAIFKQKNGVLIGLSISTIGTGLITIGNLNMLLIGAILLVIGSSFFRVTTPILLGQHFLKTDRKRNVAFMLSYLFINLGAFLGALLLGAIGTSYSWSYAFGGAIIAYICSIVSYLFVKNRMPLFVKNDVDNQTVPSSTILSILVITIVSFLFWEVYGIYNEVFIAHAEKLENLSFFGIKIPFSLLHSFPSNFSLIALIVFFFLWYKRGSGSSIFKIANACLLMGSSLFLLQVTISLPVNMFLKATILPMLLIAVAEVFVSTITVSYITRLSDVRYASTIYGAYSALLYLLSEGSEYLHLTIDNQSVVWSGVFIIFLSIILLLGKKKIVEWSGGID